MVLHEQHLLLEELSASHARIVALTSDLAEDQWRFREEPARWSIAEIVEHLVLFERFVLSTIKTCIERPSEAGNKEDVSRKQALVMDLASSRHIPFVSRPANVPTGHWSSAIELLSELQLARENTTAFVCETPPELHGHFFAHIVWGDLDCYQWLLLVSQHSLRHALQIEQVMADPAYPGCSGKERPGTDVTRPTNRF